MGVLEAPEFVETIPDLGKGGPNPKLKKILALLREAATVSSEENEWAKIAVYKTTKSASASASYMRRRYGEEFEFASRKETVYARVK